MKKILFTILFLLTLIIIPGISFAVPMQPTEINTTDTSAYIRIGGGLGGDEIGYIRYAAMSVPPVFCNQIYGANSRATKDITGTFETTIENLEPDTIYYFCGVRSSKAKIDYGVGALFPAPVYEFRTLPCQTCVQTTVETKTAYVFGPTSANLKGEYGSTKAVKTFFEYKEKANVGAWTKVGEESHSANTYGKFNFIVTGLKASTEYEFKAKAQTLDPVETFEGDILSFKTKTADGFGDGEGWVNEDPETVDPDCDESGPDAPAQGCGDPTEGDCPPGSSGTPGACVPDAPPPLDCGIGYSGIPPNCVLDPLPTCEEQGMVGVFPNCSDPAETCEDIGEVGVFPDCHEPDPTCEDLGQTGTYPQCSDPAETCEDLGQTGTFPNCDGPASTCEDLGQTGTYPNCSDPAETCEDIGEVGVFPNCEEPDPTCEEIGQTGTYPNCSDPVTNCAEMGLGGTFPNCIQPTDDPNGEDNDNDGTSNDADPDDDNDGVPDATDPDPYGGGENNPYDNDGDGVTNDIDTDNDNDGIPDTDDGTPYGFCSDFDNDKDGINNCIDKDDDNDGVPDLTDTTHYGGEEGSDYDNDGDGIPNNTDPDNDNDGIPNRSDKTPFGGGNGPYNPNNGPTLRIGDITNPPVDAIVRYHEGIETVLIRQIMKNDVLAQKYGWKQGEDRVAFSNYLAHFLAKRFGYVAKNGKEIRVRYADVAAYELRESGNTTIVYESFQNKTTKNFEVTGIRKINSLFKLIFKYEYYFLKKR